MILGSGHKYVITEVCGCGIFTALSRVSEFVPDDVLESIAIRPRQSASFTLKLRLTVVFFTLVNFSRQQKSFLTVVLSHALSPGLILL